MARMTGMKDKMKIRGIRQRWLANSISVVLFMVVLAVVAFSVAMSRYYYDAMEEGLKARANSAASFFRNYTQTEYRKTAKNYVDTFAEKSRLELQFIEPDGSILYSSYGLTTGTMPQTPDIPRAFEQAVMHSWRGRDPSTNERIMTATAPVLYQGELVGGVRIVTSMLEVDRRLMLASAAAALVGFALLAMLYISNLFFVRSIIEPLSGITETARRIADGSYGIQLEKTYDDEIGDLTDAINDMSMKIRQAEKVQTEFISSVSHELRTPLTAINGWAETIMNGELHDQKDIQKGMGIIVSEARRLTNMVEELLEFSRISDGRFTLSVEPLDLKAELEDAVYTYREFFRRDGIILNYYDCPEEMIPVSGDPERLRQVFCNLLDNAAKHGGAGKRIDVTVRVEEEAACISIRDYGPGIPQAELPFVKNKFYKGSSKARGSGIGLAVCEEIVDRHGGTLTLDNAPEGGCVVEIRIPIGT
ncbi:MAG: HAMP domain-containing histidine kinase [Oscillospiraceae bacterium]|nr:HAMP domain-containing histidine kinase [Oscillospiraceae bacterium]